MMKKIFLCPIGSVGEKRVARMLELELAERGLSSTYNNDGELCAAVFVVSEMNSDMVAEIESLSLGVPAVCCYLRTELGSVDGIHMVERPFDAAKLCESLVRLSSRDKNNERGLEISDGRATFRGETLSLTKKELALLELLYAKRGTPVSREEAGNAVFGGDSGTNVVDVYIKYLRAKLDERFDERLIVTVRNKGYMLR